MRRLVTRRSGIHGKGVFANIDIAKGTRLIEYKGERITDEESENRYPDTTHTFLFMLDSGEIIDGGSRGNTSRWINHSCEPNCEASEEKGRVFIDTLRDIARKQLEANAQMNAMMNETLNIGGALLVKLFGQRQTEIDTLLSGPIHLNHLLLPLLLIVRVHLHGLLVANQEVDVLH